MNIATPLTIAAFGLVTMQSVGRRWQETTKSPWSRPADAKVVGRGTRRRTHKSAAREVRGFRTRTATYYDSELWHKRMENERIHLARRVLTMCASGQQVSTFEILQLRNWAIRPEHSMLSLREIAQAILDQANGTDCAPRKQDQSDPSEQ